MSLMGRDEKRVREIGEEGAREVQGEVVEAKRVGEEGEGRHAGLSDKKY